MRQNDFLWNPSGDLQDTFIRCVFQVQDIDLDNGRYQNREALGSFETKVQQSSQSCKGN